MREARSAARLNHPNVGLPWIGMEYVQSRSLHQVIQEDGPFSPEDTAKIGIAVLDALTGPAYCIVMSSPINVLISNDGRVMRTDFGLAMFVDDGTVTGPAWSSDHRNTSHPSGPATER